MPAALVAQMVAEGVRDITEDVLRGIVEIVQPIADEDDFLAVGLRIDKLGVCQFFPESV